MGIVGVFKSNDWQSQPRDPETGRWDCREKNQPRTEMFCLRLTPQERRQLDEAAKAADMTVTKFVLFRTLGERREAG